MAGAGGLVVVLAVFRGGRGRGKGTFCTVAEYDSAHSPQEAANAKRMLKRLRPVAIIKPRAIMSPATRISEGPLALAFYAKNIDGWYSKITCPGHYLATQAKTRQTAYLLAAEDYHPPRRPDIDWGSYRTLCGEVAP